MQRTQVGNVRVTTFGLPEPEFKLEEADANALKRYGFPVGHNEQEQALIDRVVARLAGRAYFVEPEFEALPPHRPPPPKRKGPSGIHQSDQSDIWAGCVLEAPTPQVSYSWIAAEFTVPNVASVQEGGSGMCSHWIGIDGYTEDAAGQQLCQCGVECDTAAKGVSNPYLWVEWFPGELIRITGKKVIVSPGDLLSVVLCTSGRGATSATATFANLTTGAVILPINFSAPQGVALSGESAEWITERPLAGVIPPLAHFGSVVFYGAKAGTTQPAVNEAATHGLIQMTRINDSQTILCDAECPVDGVLINTWKASQ